MTPEELPIVDTHIHLWDLAHPSLVWSWIDTEDDHPFLGNIDSLKMRAFDVRQLHADTRYAGIEAFVHVQAARGGPFDPVDETRWVDGIAADYPKLKAIVGHTPLADPDAEKTLDRHAEASPLFCGIRDFAIESHLISGERDPNIEHTLGVMADRGLVLDLDCGYPGMAAARALAERHPTLTIVLQHIGFPRARDTDYLRAWSAAIQDLAGAPNVVCKISGVGMTDPLFSPESLAPWIRTCLGAFGPDRCMIGSNWPIDRPYSSYDAIMSIYRTFATELGEPGRTAVLSGNAKRVYRIAPSAEKP